MTPEQQKLVDSKLYTRQPEGEPPVRSSELLCRDIHAHIVSRAEWWRTNPDDSHGINTAVYVAMVEVANAINSALAFQDLERELNKDDDGYEADCDKFNRTGSSPTHGAA